VIVDRCCWNLFFSLSLGNIIFPGGAHLKWSRPDLFGPLSAAVLCSRTVGVLWVELEVHCRGWGTNGAAAAAAFIAAVEELRFTCDMVVTFGFMAGADEVVRFRHKRTHALNPPTWTTQFE